MTHLTVHWKIKNGNEENSLTANTIHPVLIFAYRMRSKCTAKYSVPALFNLARPPCRR
jgi:hypothetical protein